MLKRKYGTVVAAVLAGAALFSPLLCEMDCLEGRVEKTCAAVEVVPAAGELAAEFAGSALVGCVLTHVVLNIDLSDWMDVLKAMTWVGIGAEAAELVRGELREGLPWM
jgi:precorrin-3B methylase